jgi:hypothetical protein
MREAYDGPIVVIKGPEVGARYPDPALRPLRDLDVLVRDAPAAQRALVAAGFREVGDPDLYVDIHHLRPVLWPGLPLIIEIHSEPKWPEGLVPPPVEELLDAARESAWGVEGILGLPPAEHALLLAAHSWAHSPLLRISDLVDIAALSNHEDLQEFRRLAQRWQLGRIWETTVAAVDSVIYGERTSLPLRTWARHLPRVRDRTVFESHLEEFLSDFWAKAPLAALRSSALTLRDVVRPGVDETWRAKLGRTRSAVRNAFTRRHEHNRELGEGASVRRRRREP